MENGSQPAAAERPEPAPERDTPANSPTGPAEPGGPEDRAGTPWSPPGYTVVETALEVTGYSQTTR